ncbi:MULTISPECIES: gluconokinase [unclassified Janthinobacterium]|uniref:gluconokinase n=1 Tax=unclassified Janthinobacterium TaxID=2610881 RepID=UPI0018383583|nr:MULTISPECIES: gluconokinase [unclassified Janthinobacterium]MBB5607128.1 carbohydrate kinase (thermoresistant glucokinase family) [Janthinobacterium sp. S3T4]MBB5612853.1 carbohydrate kinase (thermoresistant glucokinase family) [Janthinobacterium sp. S3M3]
MTASRTNTLRWVVMGVSGCGKSFIGSLLASQLGVDYVEGDALHPPENVAKMAAGVPLTDADRAGWLAALRDRIAAARAQGVGLVVSCSALKRAYRELLREGDPALRFAHLDGPRAVLLHRMQDRQHFMPASLLDSQLQTLQPLQEDEAGIVLDFRQPPEMLVEQLLQAA